VASPAIDIRLSLPVAVDAQPHVLRSRLSHPLHRLHGTVAGLASHPARNVRLVREVNKVRLIENFYPRNRFFSIPVVKELFHLGLVRCRDLVTADAASDRRDSRDRGSSGARVAVLAADLEVTRVNFMAERDGLDRIRRLTQEKRRSRNRPKHEGREPQPA